MRHAKFGKHRLLPLHPTTVAAVQDYQRLRDGRPGTALDRAVFTRILAPHQGLTSGGVTQAVAAAARRAGLGTIYAHRLRHSAATAMLAQGGSLAEIGQVLRHRRPMTTAVYAKPRVLHQPGEKPQVTRSQRCRNSVPGLRTTAV